MNFKNKDIFTLLSIIFSSLSLAFFCFLFFSPILGCLGITFAFFSERQQGKLQREALISIGISIIGLILFGLIILVSLPSVLETYQSQEYLDFISQFESTYNID